MGSPRATYRCTALAIRLAAQAVFPDRRSTSNGIPTTSLMNVMGGQAMRRNAEGLKGRRDLRDSLPLITIRPPLTRAT